MTGMKTILVFVAVAVGGENQTVTKCKIGPKEYDAGVTFLV